MDIKYKSEKLEKMAEVNSKRIRAFNQHAEKVKERIDYLKAANNLSEVSHLPPIYRHKLKGDKKDCFAIRYTQKDRIGFVPFGEFDLSDISTITSIVIVFIADYH